MHKFVVAAVMLIATTVIFNMTTGSVLAYDRNQAKSDINECGNGSFPENVGCQNIDSQIQGDENAVALTAQQRFPSQEPQTCVECIFEFLTSDQIALFEEFLAISTQGEITTIEELCELSPEEQLEALEAFAAGIEGDENQIDASILVELIDCLERVSGLTP